jgi:hypothetical protein
VDLMKYISQVDPKSASPILLTVSKLLQVDRGR